MENEGVLAAVRPPARYTGLNGRCAALQSCYCIRVNREHGSRLGRIRADDYMHQGNDCISDCIELVCILVSKSAVSVCLWVAMIYSILAWLVFVSSMWTDSQSAILVARVLKYLSAASHPIGTHTRDGTKRTAEQHRQGPGSRVSPHASLPRKKGETLLAP